MALCLQVHSDAHPPGVLLGFRSVQTPPPPFSVAALVPRFRVRPLLQVRLLPPGTPVHSGTPMFRISPHDQVRLRRIGPSVCAVEPSPVGARHRLAGNVRVSPPPVYLFSGIRARKRPTDMELSNCSRAETGSLTDRTVLG
jgi:hypothetical protein